MPNKYSVIRKERKERHAKWRVQNLRKIIDSGIPCIMPDEGTMIFRNSNQKHADFYPSTGRWKDIRTGEIHSGGAYNFIKWLKE